MAQKAVACQQTTTIHYNKYDDILDIGIVSVPNVNFKSNNLSTAPTINYIINYETGKEIPVIDYGGWENNYINYRNIYEYQQITKDIEYIYDPLPVYIINDNFEVK